MPRQLLLKKPFAFVLLSFWLYGCSLNARQQTIKTTFVMTDTARDTFIAYDASHQKAIVDKATDLTSGTAALTAYRAQRAKIVELFEGIYRALVVVAQNDNAPLGTLIQDATHLKTAVANFIKEKL